MPKTTRASASRSLMPAWKLPRSLPCRGPLAGGRGPLAGGRWPLAGRYSTLAQLEGQDDVLRGWRAAVATRLQHAGKAVKSGLGQERRTRALAQLSLAEQRMAVAVRPQRRLRIVEMQRLQPR